MPKKISSMEYWPKKKSGLRDLQTIHVQDEFIPRTIKKIHWGNNGPTRNSSDDSKGGHKNLVIMFRE
jgi:hypothetical protein